MYQIKYTSIDSIRRRLRSRLKVDFLGIPSPYTNQEIATKSIDDETILDVIEDNEAYLDYFLSLVYVLPLLHKHRILQTCVDSLVIADLMSIHFTNFSENTDGSKYGVGNRNQAIQIIKQLTFGLNISLDLPNESSTNPYVYNQAIILPNETLVTSRNNVINEKQISVNSYNTLAGREGINFGVDDYTTRDKYAPRARDLERRHYFY
jgi:phage gp36-like protein